MDVDKLQRINTLARELMKHGMAGSMDEAVKMAEDKIDGSPEVSNIQETMSDDMITQAQTAASSESPAPKENDSLELRKLRNLIDEQNRTISGISGKINELVTEFNRLEQEINRLKTIQVPSGSDDDKKGTQTQFRPQKTEEKKEGHARTGSYTPEDVSVEKMFYSGTR